MNDRSRSEVDRQVDELLGELQAETVEEPLPEDFAHGVVMRAKEMRRVIRKHWHLLGGATLVALVVALVFGFRMAESHSEATAPPLHLFHPADDAAPFAIK